MALLALISDVHANLEAFEAALREVDAAGADKTICLGDVVGYGPDPAACVEVIESRRIVTVLGNHDEAAVTTRPSGDFNPAAMRSMEFTRSSMGEAHKAAIRAWPRSLSVAGVEFTHGSFGRKRYEYVITPQAAGHALAALKGDVGAVGHTHVPSVFTAPRERIRTSDVEWVQVVAGSAYALAKTHVCIVNPGSVGQPRDGDPRASWGLLDTKRRTFQARRVEYDIDRVEAKIRAAGLPEFLSQRLRLGA